MVILPQTVFLYGPKSTSMPFKGFQEGKGIRLKLADADHIMSEIEGLEFVVPRHQRQAQGVNKFQIRNFWHLWRLSGTG